MLAPAKPRIVQLSTYRAAPLLNTMPLLPPWLLIVNPRRTTSSVAPALMTKPSVAAKTETPA